MRTVTTSFGVRSSVGGSAAPLDADADASGAAVLSVTTLLGHAHRRGVLLETYRRFGTW